jgi:hypothetical protein
MCVCEVRERSAAPTPDPQLLRPAATRPGPRWTAARHASKGWPRDTVQDAGQDRRGVSRIHLLLRNARPPLRKATVDQTDLLPSAGWPVCSRLSHRVSATARCLDACPSSRSSQDLMRHRWDQHPRYATRLCALSLKTVSATMRQRLARFA